MLKPFAMVPLLVMSACVPSEPARVLYPVEVCGYVDSPVYGLANRPASDGEVILGAVIGGTIANQVTDHNDAATVVGALIGGAVAADQRKTERVIVGYHKIYQCNTVYE